MPYGPCCDWSLCTCVVACFGAAAAIVLGDLAVFLHRQVDRRLLRRASSWVVKALLVLWVTGLIIIGLDTGFDLAVLFTKGKLLAKFSVVALLTLNGLALHKWALPRLMAPTYEPERTARIPALLGAFSLASWLFAAFLGLAKPLAGLLGYAGFMQFYGSLLLALTVAWHWGRPRLARQLAEYTADSARSPLTLWARPSTPGGSPETLTGSRAQTCKAKALVAASKASRKLRCCMLFRKARCKGRGSAVLAGSQAVPVLGQPRVMGQQPFQATLAIANERGVQVPGCQLAQATGGADVAVDDEVPVPDGGVDAFAVAGARHPADSFATQVRQIAERKRLAP